MILTVRAEGNFYGAGVYVNGKRLKFEKAENSNGINYAQIAKTEVDGEVNLSVIKRSPFGYKGWFVRVALFWLLGIFGIFTPRYKKQLSALDYKLKAKITEDSEIVLRVNAANNLQVAAPTVLAGATFPFEEENNSWIKDTVAQKRRKYYHIFNGVFWVLVAAVAVILFMFINN